MAITLDTDWGAKGAQLTGAQVQAFIKGQFRELIAKDTALETTINNNANISTKADKNLNEKIDALKSLVDALNEGCFVAYHRKEDNWPVAVPYWEWPDLEDSGEVADGVLVLIDGQAPIVVAPTEKKLSWSKANYAVDTRVGTAYELAYADFTGQCRTASLMAKREKLFETESLTESEYAPSWCFNYDRSYEYNNSKTDKLTVVGITKNKWWLPSIGELLIIRKHKHAINRCLSVIKDATLIQDTWYWSSTEASATTVWRLHMGNGAIKGGNNKISYKHQTRAIASFYNPRIFNGEQDLENEITFADARITTYGDVAVFLENETAPPVAIKYPLTKEKIQSAIIAREYTTEDVARIQSNYLISQSESFDDAELKQQYSKEYTKLQKYQANAIKVSQGAFAKQEESIIG